MEDSTINESMVKVLSKKKRRNTGDYLIVASFILLLALLVWLIILYNSLVTLRQNVVTARYQIDSSVQYRENLFPLLVEAVAIFVGHEDHVFGYTSDKRTEIVKPPAKEEIQELIETARSDWRGALARILAWAENYPDLKTSESFQTMMLKMSEVEEEIYQKRVAYNDEVNIYTTAIRTFPKNTIATLLGFDRTPYYSVAGKSEWQLRGDGKWSQNYGFGRGKDATAE